MFALSSFGQLHVPMPIYTIAAPQQQAERRMCIFNCSSLFAVSFHMQWNAWVFFFVLRWCGRVCASLVARGIADTKSITREAAMQNRICDCARGERDTVRHFVYGTNPRRIMWNEYMRKSTTHNKYTRATTLQQLVHDPGLRATNCIILVQTVRGQFNSGCCLDMGHTRNHEDGPQATAHVWGFWEDMTLDAVSLNTSLWSNVMNHIGWFYTFLFENLRLLNYNVVMSQNHHPHPSLGQIKPITIM